jgi:hypothetical protein
VKRVPPEKDENAIIEIAIDPLPARQAQAMRRRATEGSLSHAIISLRRLEFRPIEEKTGEQARLL